jgi:hypothetical protein
MFCAGHFKQAVLGRCIYLMSCIESNIGQANNLHFGPFENFQGPQELEATTEPCRPAQRRCHFTSHRRGSKAALAAGTLLAQFQQCQSHLAGGWRAQKWRFPPVGDSFGMCFKAGVPGPVAAAFVGCGWRTNRRKGTFSMAPSEQPAKVCRPI